MARKYVTPYMTYGLCIGFMDSGVWFIGLETSSRPVPSFQSALDGSNTQLAFGRSPNQVAENLHWVIYRSGFQLWWGTSSKNVGARLMRACVSYLLGWKKWLFNELSDLAALISTLRSQNCDGLKETLFLWFPVSGLSEYEPLCRDRGSIEPLMIWFLMTCLSFCWKQNFLAS